MFMQPDVEDLSSNRVKLDERLRRFDASISGERTLLDDATVVEIAKRLDEAEDTLTPIPSCRSPTPT
jgi:hypothetical protein